MNCPTEGCPKTEPYGSPTHTLCWMPSASYRVIKPKSDAELYGQILKNVMPSKSVRKRLASQRNRVTVSLVENIVQRPPEGMDGWRFYRIEYSNGIETAIWLPPDCDPDSIEALLEGRQDV